MFDCRTNRTPIERLGSIGFDWFLVRFRSISYAGCTLRTVRAFHDPYELDELKLYSADRKGTWRSVRIERTEFALRGSLQCGCIGHGWLQLATASQAYNQAEVMTIFAFFLRQWDWNHAHDNKCSFHTPCKRFYSKCHIATANWKLKVLKLTILFPASHNCLGSNPSF